MNNQFRNDLLIKLDNKYDGVNYDENSNLLKVTINKNAYVKELSEIIKDLSMEIMYPLRSFDSNNESYIFTYRLREE